MTPSSRMADITEKLQDAQNKDVGGPCGSFAFAYHCMCDYHNVPFSEEVAWVIEQTFMTLIQVTTTGNECYMIVNPVSTGIRMRFCIIACHGMMGTKFLAVLYSRVPLDSGEVLDLCLLL